MAARRYEVVDPAKRLVARELEARWNGALEPLDPLADRIDGLDAEPHGAPDPSRGPTPARSRLRAAWHASGTDARTKRWLTRILISAHFGLGKK